MPQPRAKFMRQHGESDFLAYKVVLYTCAVTVCFRDSASPRSVLDMSPHVRILTAVAYILSACPSTTTLSCLTHVCCRTWPPQRQLKEGLSALMQHPNFLAALVGQGQGNGVPVAPSASKEEAPAARPSNVVSNTSTAAVSHGRAISDNGGNPSRASTPVADPEHGGDSITADGGSGNAGNKSISSSSSGASSGVGGAGSGGCGPGRSQVRGEFHERLPRSEEACA